MKARQRLHNRATPSADPLAGLKKYTVISPFAPAGEYVHYSEAAKIIAAKDAEIERLNIIVNSSDMMNELAVMLNDAQEELALIKAQEPAMWLCVRDYGGSDRAITTSSPSRRDILKAEGYEITPLYFPPHAPEGERD